MEAAAKSINRLSQHLLPDQPHHLSIRPDWRYKPHEDRRPDRPEEWGNIPLQYMTLLSDADRGVLLTRSYYDMREESHKPVPKEVSSLSKGGEKKKLSLSDYKNKKTTGATSTSPPEPSIAKKRDIDAGAGAGASPIPNGPSPKPAADTRPPRPTNGSERSRQTSSLLSAESKLPPKPSKHPLPPRPPTPEARKRVADPDDDPRHSKRPRPEAERLAQERARTPRDEPVRRREPVHDRNSARDGRAVSSSTSIPNGRSMLKDAVGPGRNSPAAHSHSRNSSLNGIRHNASAASSMRNTPVKAEATSKAFVPPLLSPLHFDVDDMEADSLERRDKKPRERIPERDRERDRDRERERDRGRDRDPVHREKERDVNRDRERIRERERERERDRDDRSAKPKKQAEPSVKRERSPLKLPPLLSPTLPPEVEDAFEKWRKKQPSSSSDDGELPGPRELKKVPPLQLAGKKRLPDDLSDDEGKDTKPPPRKRLMVRLRIPKRLRKDVSRILKMGDRDVQRSERQPSVEAASGAKKRPPTGDEAGSNEVFASKRPRTSEASSLLPNPATPSKKASTAMSRVSSTNSQANTPGEPSSHHRPSSADPPPANGTARPLPPISPADQARAERLRPREVEYLTLGKRLKKEGESLLASGRNRADTSRGKADLKLGCVKYLEGLVAFALAFQTQYTHRQLVRQYVSASAWSSILPAVDALRGDVRRLGSSGASLVALVVLLQARAFEEILKCYGTYPSPEQRIRPEELLRLVNSRAKSLIQAREILADSPVGRGGILKGVEMGAWMSVEEACDAIVRVIRRWCADEEVDWTPEVSTRGS